MDDAETTLSGSIFQILVAATGKARLQMVVSWKMEQVDCATRPHTAAPAPGNSLQQSCSQVIQRDYAVCTWDTDTDTDRQTCQPIQTVIEDVLISEVWPQCNANCIWARQKYAYLLTKTYTHKLSRSQILGLL